MNPTMASFILSAWWHGFYPAFYLMFLTLGLNLMAARKVTTLCSVKVYLYIVLLPDAESASSSFSVTPNS